jgi:hypothetical protein
VLCCGHFTIGLDKTVALHLNVSRESRQKLSALVRISEEGFAEISALLASQVEHFGSLANVREVAKDLKHCSAEAVDIVQALMPHLMGPLADGNKASDVVAAIIAALQRESGATLLLSDPKDLSVLRKRLTSLFSSDQIALKTKAMVLVNERPSLFYKAKIISDLRPVFEIGKGKGGRVEACSIIHTLVLSCSENGELVKHHIALDSSDLAALKVTVERAQAKEVGLTNFIEAAKVSKIVIS